MREVDVRSFVQSLENLQEIQLRCWWVDELLEAMKRGDYWVMQHLMIVDFRNRGLVGSSV